jgi:hypothetical protein
MMPNWLHSISLAALAIGAACAIVLLTDLYYRPQPMWVMNAVWPVNALFGTVLTLWLYFRFARRPEKQSNEKNSHSGSSTPYPVMVAKGAMHCGAGCTLGDIIAETLTLMLPIVAVWAGWHWLFSEKMFAVWIVDFVFAFALGIAFQYFTIKPMRNLSPGQGLIEALKADFLSLTAWQVGMYGFMAIAQFYLFRYLLNLKLEANMPEFWFMMQIAMIAGFLTSYPVNWWLLRTGIKERM